MPYYFTAAQRSSATDISSRKHRRNMSRFIGVLVLLAGRGLGRGGLEKDFVDSLTFSSSPLVTISIVNQDLPRGFSVQIRHDKSRASLLSSFSNLSSLTLSLFDTHAHKHTHTRTLLAAEWSPSWI